jgi:hypothetical protein
VRGALLLDLPLSGVRWLGGDQQRGFRGRGEPSGTRTGRITTSGSQVSIEDAIKARAHILGKKSSPAAPKMDCRLVALHPRAQGGAALRGVDGGLRRTPSGVSSCPHGDPDWSNVYYAVSRWSAQFLNAANTKAGSRSRPLQDSRRHLASFSIATVLFSL